MTTSNRTVVVLKGYPRLSETFIAQELRALERRGLRLALVALRHPTDKAVHPIHREIEAPVTYLPEYLHDDPGRVLRGFMRAVRLPGFSALLRQIARDLRRDPTRNRLRRFGQALVLGTEVLGPGDQLYAHFLHTPASVTRYAATLRGLAYGVSAHAKDIWTIPDWEKREKLEGAAFAVTCTRLGADHLNGLARGGVPVELIYHGLDLSRLPAPPRRARPGEPMQILCVARAVPKKGLDVVLAALARLPNEPRWRFVHIGGGDTAPLHAQAERLGIADRVTFRGALAAPDVFEAYRASDVFVLASRVAADGDRDGLPNVLMEALSQELPIVATAVGAIPELIDDGVHGLLVRPDDAAALAAALERTLNDPARARALAVAGRARLQQAFAMDRGIDRLVALLGHAATAEAA